MTQQSLHVMLRQRGLITRQLPAHTAHSSSGSLWAARVGKSREQWSPDRTAQVIIVLYTDRHTTLSTEGALAFDSKPSAHLPKSTGGQMAHSMPQPTPYRQQQST